MKIEHFALNVAHPIEMADWYVKHLGLKIVRQASKAPFTTFLSDDSDQVMLEIYCNPVDEVPDYRNMNPLLVHLAFVSDDPARDAAKLKAVGAELVTDQRLDDGSHLIMMRDPWGISIQLCKRGTPMLS